MKIKIENLRLYRPTRKTYTRDGKEHSFYTFSVMLDKDQFANGVYFGENNLDGVKRLSDVECELTINRYTNKMGQQISQPNFMIRSFDTFNSNEWDYGPKPKLETPQFEEKHVEKNLFMEDKPKENEPEWVEELNK